MASSRRLEVIIAGDAKGAKGAMDDVEGRSGRLGSRMSSIFQGVGLAAGNMLAELPGQAITFFKGAIDAASDLGETVSKNQTIFGDAANDLISWADSAPKALGMTKQAALDATGGLGNLFTQLGITTDQARKMSQSNVQLAADFASFHNADPTEVLDSISAAYRGEYDALQKYVPVISAAKVEEAALAMTHKSSAKELTEKDKALAVDKLMMDGAGKAAGDFARTSGSAANQSKIAGAAFADLQVKIGNVLLPAWTALLGFVTGSFLPGMMALGSWLSEKLSPAFAMLGSFAAEVWPQITAGFTQLVDGLSNAVAVLEPFYVAIQGNQVVLTTLAIVIGGVVLAAVAALTASMAGLAISVVAATWPFLAIIAVIAAMVAGVIWAWNNWEFFRNAIGAVVAYLIVTVPPAFEMIRAAVAMAFDWIANVAVPAVVGAFNSFIGFMQGTLWPAVQMIWSGIQIAIGWAVNAIKPILDFLVQMIQENFGHIAEIASIMWDWIRNIISNAWQVISNIIQLFLNVISGNWGAAWDNIKNIAAAVWDAIRNTVANGVGAIREMIQGLANVIGNLGGRMWEGLTAGFRNAWNAIAGRVNSFPSLDVMGVHVGMPNVPMFAGGGVFRAPTPGGAGPAILHDGETVLTPDQARAMGGRGGNLTIVLPNAYLTQAEVGRAVDDALREYDRQGGRPLAWTG